MAERKKVRIAIIGVGNCASSLVQGVRFYGPAFYFMKTPPKQFKDSIALEIDRDFHSRGGRITSRRIS